VGGNRAIGLRDGLPYGGFLVAHELPSTLTGFVVH
jgi:hypothetical protein